MGTWGPGNFDNDTADDYLIGVYEPFLTQIIETVKSQMLMEPDEIDSIFMMCNMEILLCLAENIGRYATAPQSEARGPSALPPPDTVAEWKRAYLKVWDGYIDDLDPDPEYRRDRRLVLLDTFERFEKLAQSFHAPTE